jgi:hypothetical protein
VKSDIAVCQENLVYRVCDGFAAERSLAGSAAATESERYPWQIGVRLSSREID